MGIFGFFNKEKKETLDISIYFFTSSFYLLIPNRVQNYTFSSKQGKLECCFAKQLMFFNSFLFFCNCLSLKIVQKHLHSFVGSNGQINVSSVIFFNFDSCDSIFIATSQPDGTYRYLF